MNTSSTRWHIVLAILLGAIILALAGLLVTAGSILLLAFAGILFGIFLNGLSRFLSDHTPLSYAWSYVLVVALLVAILAGGFYYMGSQIIAQISQLSGQLASAGTELTQRLEKYPLVRKQLPELQGDEIVSQAAKVLPSIGSSLQWLAWGLTGIVVVLFVGLYAAFDPHLYESGLIKLVPQPRRARAVEILQSLRTVLGLWIIGRLISMSIVGVLTALALWLLDVPLPLTLGVVAALLTFIPNIGPILAAVPQALLALKVGTNTVLYVILFNIAMQTVESYVITPMVQRHQVTLPPALTIIAQLLLGVLFGAVGLLMAAPVTVTIMLLMQMLYIQDRLGDPKPGKLVAKAENGS